MRSLLRRGDSFDIAGLTGGSYGGIWVGRLVEGEMWWSGQYNDEVRHHPKVADVTGCNAEAEMKSCRRDEQIFERDGDALGSSVTLDSAGQPGYLDGHRMNWNIPDQLVHEYLPSLSAFVCARSRDAVSEFHDRHNGQTYLYFSVDNPDLFQYLPNRPAVPLSGDCHAGVKD